MIKNYIRDFSILILLIGLSVFMSCSSMNTIEEIDYSKKSSWLALPQNMEEHPVDVFFVYPTIYQGEGVQDITDPQQIGKSKEPLYTQASVFSDSANIYAPMYRQLGKSGFAQSDAQLQLLIGEKDVKQAFLYYLQHYNKGKPFIIAGHSQGSSTLISLLRKIWGTTGAEERMIGTYIIGFSITQEDIDANPAIRMSSGPYDTGCFIAYNSIRDGVQDQSVQILKNSIVTNPLSWISSKENGSFVAAQEHLGAIFFSEDYEETCYPHFTSAQVIDGGLACIVADETVLSDYPIEGIYHRDDYSLFYKNIEENVKQRIESYMSK